MASVKREFVHRDHVHVGQVGRAQLSLQHALVDRFHGIPSKAEEFGHMPD
jgi:hypothetical protein